MKEENQLHSKELQAFLEWKPMAGDSTSKASSVLQRSTQLRRVVKDLAPNRKRIIASYLGFHALGYGLSLTFCAQFGVGFISISHSIADVMHRIPWPWCPLICGFLYTIPPLLLSRLLLSRFQQRYLFTRVAWLPISTPLAACLLLLVFGSATTGDFSFTVSTHSSLSHGMDAGGGAWVLLWTFGAILSSFAADFVQAKRLLRKKHRRVLT